MPPLALPPALGPAGHAARLVAGEALLGLPVSRGARPPRRAPQRKDKPPPAPWGSFPLSELVVLVAIGFLVGGLFVAPPRGAVMIGAGLALGSLAGLELAVREHFAGYRSHTMLLAGAVGLATVVAAVALAKLSPLVALIAGAAGFGAGVWIFTRAFRRRSGATFRVR